MKAGDRKMSIFIQALIVAGIMTVGTMIVPFCVLAADAPAAEPESPHTVNGNVYFLTDYVWRGLSQLTWGSPAIQGGLGYAHASGFYAGIWGGNISANIYPNVQMELDVFAGYGGKISDDWTYDAGAYMYTYQGANYNRFVDAGLPDKRFDTVELYAGITYKWFGIKLWYAVTDFLGYSDKTTPIGSFGGNPEAGVRSGDTKGSTYIEANANFPLFWDLTLGLHVGHETVNNGTELDWSDWMGKLTKDLGKGWSTSLAYTGALDANEYSKYPSAAGQGSKNLNKTQLTFAVGRAF